MKESDLRKTTFEWVEKRQKKKNTLGGGQKPGREKPEKKSETWRGPPLWRRKSHPLKGQTWGGGDPQDPQEKVN